MRALIIGMVLISAAAWLAAAAPSSNILPIAIELEAVFKGNVPITGNVVMAQTNCGSPAVNVESATAPIGANAMASFSLPVDFSRPSICLTLQVNDPTGLNIMSVESPRIPNVQPFIEAGAFTVTKATGKIVVVKGCTNSATCKPVTANSIAAGSGFAPTFTYTP
jgi:hypothetical protein